MKYATAIIPERMNAVSLVNKPTTIKAGTASCARELFGHLAIVCSKLPLNDAELQYSPSRPSHKSIFFHACSGAAHQVRSDIQIHL